MPAKKRRSPQEKKHLSYGMELSRQGWEWIATGPEPGSPGQMRWLRTMATVRASFLHPSRTRSEAPVAEKAD